MNSKSESRFFWTHVKRLLKPFKWSIIKLLLPIEIWWVEASSLRWLLIQETNIHQEFSPQENRCFGKLYQSLRNTLARLRCKTLYVLWDVVDITKSLGRWNHCYEFYEMDVVSLQLCGNNGSLTSLYISEDLKSTISSAWPGL